MKQFIKATLLTFLSIFMMLCLTAASCNKTDLDEIGGTPRTTNVPDEFVATWYYGNPSFTENHYTDGTWSNVVGNAMFFRFSKDGFFETAYQNYVDASGCKLISGTYRKGTFTVAGNKLTLYDTKAKSLSMNSCQPDSDLNIDMPKENGEVVYAQRGVDAWGYEGIYMTHNADGSNPTFFQKR
jgi:hypothetical protein